VTQRGYYIPLISFQVLDENRNKTVHKMSSLNPVFDKKGDNPDKGKALSWWKK